MKRERNDRENEAEYKVKKKCLTVEIVDEVATTYGEEIVLDHESNPLSSSYYDVNSYKTDTLDDVIIGENNPKADMVVANNDIEYSRHFWQGEGLDLSKSTLDISVISAGVDNTVDIVENTTEDTLSDNSSDDTSTSDSSVYDSSDSDSSTTSQLDFATHSHPYEVSSSYNHLAVGIQS